ncbi:hypothetical protein DQ04_04151130, partial [Trypanosoma grayi]|uniref:hypothetical protein n=1 Tax=Trypanosoma grayi TaxID=71804 RepID=UPI0004F3F5F1
GDRRLEPQQRRDEVCARRRPTRITHCVSHPRFPLACLCVEGGEAGAVLSPSFGCFSDLSNFWLALCLRDSTGGHRRKNRMYPTLVQLRPCSTSVCLSAAPSPPQRRGEEIGRGRGEDAFVYLCVGV